MYRTIIVARMEPKNASSVAKVFGDSDATELPHELGVQRRSLYNFHDLYLHVVDFNQDPAEALRRGPKLPGFQKISKELRPFINPYDPNWQKPEDAVAREFYQWTVKK